MGTFILLFMYLLIELHYCNINKLTKDGITIQNMMYHLLDARKKYLEEHGITVMHKSPYQEFILECHGKTVDNKVDAQTRMLNRKKKGVMIKLRYTPNEDDPNAEKYKVNFDNHSGNIITNPNKLYIS
jgi:exonuclease III